MKESRRFIQTIRFVLACSVVAYALICRRLPTSGNSNPIVLRAITAMAVVLVIVIFVMRRIQVLPVEAILTTQSPDPKALLRWRKGYLTTYALSVAIALYGLALHFLGSSFMQVVPFFVAGLALILFLGPVSPKSREFPSATDARQ